MAYNNWSTYWIILGTVSITCMTPFFHMETSLQASLWHLLRCTELRSPTILFCLGLRKCLRHETFSFKIRTVPSKARCVGHLTKSPLPVQVLPGHSWTQSNHLSPLSWVGYHRNWGILCRRDTYCDRGVKAPQKSRTKGKRFWKNGGRGAGRVWRWSWKRWLGLMAKNLWLHIK